MSKKYNYAFTHNNYTNTELEDNLECRYIIYGKEVGESGTPHLQGVVCFKCQKSETAVRKLMIGCHVKPVLYLEKAIEYCKKDGDFTERGDQPMTQSKKGEKGKEYWKEQLEFIKVNSDEIDPQLQVTMPRNIEFIQAKEQQKKKFDDTEEKMLWYYGETGTGKSRKARTDHPDAYLKGCNKWWDHYNGEETVIIEDFDKAHDKLSHHLKIWGDRYQFPAEFKGGQKKIRPKLIIVTSNWHPQDIWNDPNDVEPICRRFTPVKFPLKDDIEEKKKKRKRSPSPPISKSKREPLVGSRALPPSLVCSHPALQDLLDEINE